MSQRVVVSRKKYSTTKRVQHRGGEAEYQTEGSRQAEANNDSKCTSAHAKEFFREEGTKVVNGSSQPRDLNSIRQTHLKCASVHEGS